MPKRKILITGSSGGLGSALTHHLSKSHDIVQLSLQAPTSPTQQTIGAVVVGSILDSAALAQAMEGVDTVIHSAAIPWSSPPHRRTIETNILGTFCVLEEAGKRKHVEQFIYISSLCWHGICDSPAEEHLPQYLPIDEAHPSLAVFYYSCSKVMGEYWCQKYVERFRKPAVAVRPSHIVRPEREATFEATPPGAQPALHDYVGTSDLVDGIERALDYDPLYGFDAILFHAEDQGSTTPSLTLAERHFPQARLDREKLAACDGFGAFVDCSYALDKLGWRPKFRCKRSITPRLD